MSSTPSIAGLDRAAWDEIPDEEAVERVRSGDTALYELLMRRYNRRVYRAARAILRNDDEAEDVMQEAYVRAYEHLADFAGEAKFSTWLTKIAIYEAISRLRKRARVEELDSTSNADAPLRASTMPDEYNPERRAYDGELRSVLERAVDTLPEEYRSVVVLRLVEEMSVAETAECLDIGIETVKTRLHRARAMLRKQLQSRVGVVAPEIYAFHLSRCDRVVQAVFRRIHSSD